MSTELTLEQWTELLSLLSLEGALPLYEAMGVPVENKSDFQKKLREVILNARHLYEASPDHVPAVAAMLFDRLGNTVAQPFAAWAQGVFLGYHADQPDWSAWDIVFSQWAYSRHRDLGFLPQEKQNAFLLGYKQTVVTDDIKRKGEELLLSSLSDWDLEMFTRRGYSASWESSPYSTAESIVRIERLKKFAGQVWRNLTPGERDIFQKQAQTLIDSLKVWMPGVLPSLDRLLLPS